MTVISIDISLNGYSDTGVVALRSTDSGVGVAPIDLESAGLVGTPRVGDLGSFLASLASELNAEFIFVDGPQGWKAPDDALEFSRRCEDEVGSRSRTGLPGVTKPAEYQRYAEFCIELFDELAALMFPRLSTTGSWPAQVTVESYPAAAWRSLGIPALPSTGEATAGDIANRIDALEGCFPLDLRGDLSAAGLQAAVVGLAGVALERRNLAGLAFAGVEPMLVDGTWREGYILSPTRDALSEPN